MRFLVFSLKVFAECTLFCKKYV